MFSAFLDANVMWPNMRRNFLLALAVERAYRPLWSEVILDELEEHETRKLVDRQGWPKTDAAERAARLTAEMRRGFPDAIVTGWEPMEGTYGLPDPDDEHVVAAAHLGGAGAIVTLNLRHFPASKIPASIEVVTPQEFAFTTASMFPGGALRAAESIVAFSGQGGQPKRTLDEVLAQLKEVYGMDDLVDLLEDVRAGD